jgi:alpha-L-arabinofuranosidase
MLGIPTLNIDESPEDMADFIEYVNGDVTTTWGARRAADGHAAPYDLQRIELGNEELIDDAYAAKFIALAAVIWAKAPTLVLTVGDMSYHHVISDPAHVTGSEQPKMTTLAAYKKILDFAATKGGHLAIDVHTWTDNPEKVATEVDALASFDYWVHQYNPAVDYEVDVFELNANRHDVSRALGNARAIGLLEQRGGRVKVVTSANALQANGKNDNGWDQGLIFYDTQRSWLQPPAYVSQMIADNPLSSVVNSTSSNPDLTVTAKTDGVSLLLEVVNASGSAQTPTITLVGYRPASGTVQVTSLAGNRGDSNEAANVTLVRPQQTSAPLQMNGATFRPSFAANSFTLLRLQ